jgi:hypothetical protein
MSTQYLRTEVKTLETPIKEKQLQSEDAGEKDLLLEQIKRLYVEMKKLNLRLQNCLQESGLESHR